MKVIGRTASGFIVEASEEELALAAGYGGQYDEAWRKLLGGSANADEIASLLRGIRHDESKAKHGADALRLLANAIERSLPTVLFPEPPAPPPAEGTPAP